MQVLPIIAILMPALAAFVPSLIKRGHMPRAALVSALAATFALVALAALSEAAFDVWSFHPLLTVSVGVDGFSKLFSLLFALLATIVCIYAFSYMESEHQTARFFKYFFLTYSGMLGTCYAKNLFTFLMFFEMVTLCSLPMVLHEETDSARRAGVQYVGYSIFGAALALILLFSLSSLGIAADFTRGGLLSGVTDAQKPKLLIVCFLAIAGFGAKAGMYPLNAWLPEAHPVAPSPASAFMSGAILKCGALGIIRVIYTLAGADFLRNTWVQYALLALALITILIGSTLALFEKKIKRRFAYSSLSQLSYALLGIFTFSTAGVVAAVMQLIFHAFAKTILFLWAGVMLKSAGATTIDELHAVGRKTPAMTACFIAAALSLLGIPPLPGFMSKFALAQASLSLSFPGFLGVAVLIVSSVLTAGYLLPIAAKLLFPDGEYTESLRAPSALMVAPTAVLSAGLLALGLFSGPLSRAITALIQGLL